MTVDVSSSISFAVDNTTSAGAETRERWCSTTSGDGMNRSSNLVSSPIEQV